MLRKIGFTPEHLHRVQEFECGAAPWEREVAEWIKGGPGGVLDDMRRGCEVWLYEEDNGQLVGFSSLAASRWRWPGPNDPRVPINIIPFIGVQQRFQGQPAGPVAGRYSSQILDHVIWEACQRPGRFPLLGLFVHPENRRAIRFYENAGFTPFAQTYTDRESGVTYISMMLDLPVG